MSKSVKFNLWANLRQIGQRDGVSANQGSDHNGGGIANTFGREVKQLNWLCAPELLYRQCISINVHLHM